MGSSEKGSPGLLSNADSDADDCSPASLYYSSCGESEHERYCSANSFLDTASVCSSLGSRSELLESFRSFGGRDELSTHSGSGAFRTDSSRFADAGDMDRFDCLSDATGEFHLEIGSYEDRVFWGRLETLPRLRTSSSNRGKKITGTNSEISKKLSFSTLADSSQEHANGVSNGKGSSETSLQASSSCHASVDKTASFCGDLSSGRHPLNFPLFQLSERNGIMHDINRDSQDRCCLNQNARLQHSEDEIHGNVKLNMNPVVVFGNGDQDKILQQGEGNASAPKIMKPNSQEWDYTNTTGTLTCLNSLEHFGSTISRGTHQKEDVRKTQISTLQIPVHKDSVDGMKIESICIYEISNIHGDDSTKGLQFHQSKLSNMPFCENTSVYSISNREFQDDETRYNEEQNSVATHPLVQNGRVITKMSNKKVVANEIDKFDINGCLDKMEEILLHSRKYNLRDGSSTASTFHKQCSYPLMQHPSKIDSIEVVGTEQKKGEVSFGERLIGANVYGVYKLQVRGGKDQWEIERRYRDFFLLYRQLKALFTDHGLSLPSPWSKVERESRKIFGNASPHVINKRSILIQDCLHSILNTRTPFGMPSSLVWFLSPSKELCNSRLLNNLVPESLQKLRDDVKSASYCGESGMQDDLALSKNMPLLVEIKPRRPKKILLEEQHFTCAGCHRYLDSQKSLMQEFIQTLGWGGPEVCDYTGRLFCTSCHRSELAVLPARVLHHWDFSLHPVSHVAKTYLDSIYNQALLCISAVNPSLCLKVPSLGHVMDIRKKIRTMLPYIRCPFRVSIQRDLGSRKYLLEGNDLFPLRDLVDLSKGAFAALPTMVERLFDKIRDHIMQQCLACYDIGVPCAAHHDCGAHSTIIFPLQEAEAVRCTSCGLIFHDACFGYLAGCQCGNADAVSRIVGILGPRDPGEEIELDGVVDSPTRKPYLESSAGYISDLLINARPEFLWKQQNGNSVVTMDFLPDSLV